MKRKSPPIHLLVIGSEEWISDLESSLNKEGTIDFTIEKVVNEFYVKKRLEHNHYDVLIVQGGYCKHISDREIATLGFAMGRPVQIVYNSWSSYIFNKLFVFGHSRLFRKSLVAKEFVTLCHKVDQTFITRIKILSKIYHEFFNEVVKTIDSNYYKYYQKSSVRLNAEKFF